MANRRCCNILTRFDSRFFKALCDPNRLAILARLTQLCGPAKVGEVASCCPIDFSVVSRHLRILKDAGIVESEKQGREVKYRVRYGAIAQTLRGLAEALESCCPSPTAHSQGAKK